MTDLEKLESRCVELGLDFVLNNTDLLDGYEFGITEEHTHTRFCVVLHASGRGNCYGIGATLTEAANNALDVLEGKYIDGDVALEPLAQDIARAW
jgi:hypothetical protein